MTTYTITQMQNENQIDVEYEASKFALNAGTVMAALIGIWGIACLVGGLVTNGAGSMLKGFLMATLGC